MVKIDNIIKTNRRHGGALVNRSNLDFAVQSANKEKNIYKSNAHLIRGIVVNHPFLDGNKSTVSEVVLKRFAKRGIKCNKKLFEQGIVDIARSNEGDINKIKRRLEKWCPK